MKADKGFLLVTIAIIYMLLSTYLHLGELPFLISNIALSFFLFIFLPGYCVTRIALINRPLKPYEIVMYSFSLGTLLFSSMSFLLFIFNQLPLINYFLFILSYLLYILMKLRTRSFGDTPWPRRRE